MRIKSKVKKVISKSIKLVYKLLYKYIPVDKKMVLFISFHGKGYICNPKYIHEYMSNNEKFNEYRFIWAIKSKYTVKVPGSKVVRYNSIAYYYYLARSKYWIVNYKLPYYIMKKSNQVYLQTWHGTPLKRLAHDIVEKDNMTFYRSEMSRSEMLNTYDTDVKKYNYLLSPNRFSTEKFISAFKVDREKIIEEGYPRVDFLLNVLNTDVIRIKEKYGIPLNKKVILYAPTWRDNSYNNKGYSYNIEVDFEKWRKILGDEYVVIFKPHYLIIDNYNNEGLEEFVYIMKENIDINELYIVSDILITDYSSVFFDYAVLKRPILFYMYDLEEYRDELRGFYLDINKDLPGPIYTVEDELLKYITNIEKYSSNLINNISLFNRKFNFLQDGRSAERIVKMVFDN